MTDLLTTVRELKTKAKNRRDLGRYKKAIEFLDAAIRMLDDELKAASDSAWRCKLAAELADCWGLIGGIQRRWSTEAATDDERREHMLESIRAYDKGHGFESAREFDISNSYNLLNRLLSRIFLDPGSLGNGKPGVELPDDVEDLKVPRELELAGETVREQLKVRRRGDIWAMADLALINLLLNKGDAHSEYAEFNSASPAGWAYDSVLSTLRPLSELDLAPREKLQEAVKLLEAAKASA